MRGFRPGVLAVACILVVVGCLSNDQDNETTSLAGSDPSEDTPPAESLEDTLDESPPPQDEESSGNLSEEGPWAELEGRREDALHALAIPIRDCVNDRGEGWPAFDGCIDWHSSVHAHYALLEVSRLTSDPSYADVALAQATPTAIDEEMALLQEGALEHENPYGYAWALLAAQAREFSAEDTSLRPLAEAVYRNLGVFLEQTQEQSQLTEAFADPAYGSAAWAVTNMARWAQTVGDEPGAARLAELTARHAGEALELLECGEIDEHGTSFFSPCLLLVHALVEVAPCEAEALLSGVTEEDWVVDPLTPGDLSRVHMAGQNFARAWGYWSLYELTGESWAREAYAEHVLTHLAQPAYWAEDHDRYSHWVAQFGVYALALSDPTSTLTRTHDCGDR